MTSLIKVVYNDALREFLKKHRIYLQTTPRERFKDGQTLLIEANAEIEPYTAVRVNRYLSTMGAFSYTNSTLYPYVERVGRYASIGPGVIFLGSSHPYDRLSTSAFTYGANYNLYKDYLIDTQQRFRLEHRTDDPGRCVIEHDVWIGQNVTLSRGVKLGTGCIVGANALVTKDVPPYAIVGGVPAKVIKYRFSPEVIERLLASEWWQYGFHVFGEDQAFMDPIKVLDLLDRKREEGTLQPFTPDPLVADDGLLQRIYGDDIPPQLLPR